MRSRQSEIETNTPNNVRVIHENYHERKERRELDFDASHTNQYSAYLLTMNVPPFFDIIRDETHLELKILLMRLEIYL